MGSKHPECGFPYEINYGFVPGTLSGDGEELDAYVLGVPGPVAEFTGKCIAIIHRPHGNDDKLVVVPEGINPEDEEIERQIAFQERWFDHVLIRK
jgi:inorganic pyrophosphatase